MIPNSFAGSVPVLNKAAIKTDNFVINLEDCRALEVKIEEETFVSGLRVPLMESPNAAFDQLKGVIKADPGPRYFLLNADNVNVFVLWIPEETPIKKKFLYTQSASQLKSLEQSKMWKDFRSDEIDELNEQSIRSSIQVLAPAERASAMTAQERERAEVDEAIEYERASRTSAAQMMEPGSTTQIRLPGMSNVARLADSFTSAVSGLQNGEIVVARADETATVNGKAEKGTIASVSLAPADCAYLVARGEDGHVVLVSYTADGAPSRAKMKHSSCVATVKKSVRECGFPEATFREAHDADDLEEIAKAPTEGRRLNQSVSGQPGSMRAGSLMSGMESFVDALEEPASSEDGSGAKKLPPGAVAMPGMSGGSMKKPPPGAVALPGMGGPLPGLGGAKKPPPGAVAMPGMGAK